MPKATLVFVIALFGIICGNRLLDSRSLRSSSLSSYTMPYKSISDVNMNSFNGKIDDNLKLKTLDKTPKSGNLPCGTDFDFDHDLSARHCNDNIVNLLKNPTNYLTYDNIEDNSIGNSNGQDVEEFDDVVHVETLIPKSNVKNMKILQSRFNMLPLANYKDFYNDLIAESAKEEMQKRNGNALTSVLGAPPSRGCDCKIRNDLLDLGQQHFPRYLLNAICHSHSQHGRLDLSPKCWSGSVCRPMEYKVKVLTFRSLTDSMQKDATLAWLPDDLRQIWKFKTVTVTAGCFCS